MKKKQWFCIAAIILCAAVFLGYRVLDGIRTDDRAPEITVDGTLTLSVLEPREALLQGVSAKDDRDGNVTASLVVESITMLSSDGTCAFQNVLLGDHQHMDRCGRGHIVKGHHQIIFVNLFGRDFTLDDFTENAVIHGVYLLIN